MCACLWYATHYSSHGCFADHVADGGGIRGLSSLYILRSIMERVNKERKKESKDDIKPCDVFDLICGTSTGG
jgi:patatin-like phospholipase/acyl hydrolase